MKKLITLLIAGLTLSNAIIGFAAELDRSPVTVSCNDTIAGLTSEIRVKTLKDTKISFVLENEYGKNVFLQEVSDEDGIVEFEISDYHLKKSGDYTVAARFSEKDEDFGKRCHFEVYPGDVSTQNSKLTVDRKTAEASLFESIVAEVELKDEYGNPVRGHSIKLLSSRTNDYIQLLSQLPYTDEQGSIAFLVSSETAGMSTLTAIDLSEDETLQSREKIAFLSEDSQKEVGGSSFSYYDDSYGSYMDDARIFLSSVENAGEIYKFIVDVDDQTSIDEAITIKRNDVVTVQVTAVDELENIVPNYTGTIRFSSTDENSILPEDYNFTADDLGSHEFALGVTFKTEGPHILSVTDIDNFTLTGEAELDVIPSTKMAPQNSDSTISLTSPNNGTFNKDSIKVSGQTVSENSVTVFLDDTEYETSKANSDGLFELTVKGLSEGDHEIYATSMDGSGDNVSQTDTKQISIDTVKPVIESFKILPESITTGSEIKVELTSESDLSKSTLLIREQVINLVEDSGGAYSATFTAPSEPGDYTIDVILTDFIGNEASFNEQSTFKVLESDELNSPSVVTEITHLSEDKKVTLSWAASEDDTYISKYKISYGTDPEKLYLEALTFDSSTTWYIPNLENEVEYYFGIQAVDSDGNESEISELIKASAISPEPEEPASLEDPVILEELPSKTPETGPELWFMVIASLLIIDIFYRKKSTI